MVSSIGFWNRIQAANLTVGDGGVLTHSGCWTNGSAANTNRLLISCGDLTIAAGGAIDVTGKGFAGGQFPGGIAYTNGHGPGGGAGPALSGVTACGGGGYGGAGGKCTNEASGPGCVYGNPYAPWQPGSGGGCYTSATGGPGGGAVWIEATGRIVVNGGIRADGVRGGPNFGGISGGAGSGGGIMVFCRSIAGSGRISADGGVAEPCTYIRGGGGGGGRIAIVYDEAAQAGETVVPQLSAAEGEGGAGGTESVIANGDPGTIVLTNTALFPRSPLAGGRPLIPGFSAWTVTNPVFTNGTTVFPTGMVLTAAGDMTLLGRGAFRLTNGSLSVGGSLVALAAATNTWSHFTAGPGGLLAISGDVRIATGQVHLAFGAASNCLIGGGVNVNRGLLGIYGASGQVCECWIGSVTVTNSGVLRVVAGATNLEASPHMLCVNVAGSVIAASTGIIESCSDPLRGGAVKFVVGSLAVETTAVFTAEARGFSDGRIGAGGWGPGGSTNSIGAGGAGYGGAGGSGGHSNGTYAGAGGICYGDSNAPTLPGSGAGIYLAAMGGHGGGVIWVESPHGRITLDGTVNACGGSVLSQSGGGEGGGGAGGSVFLKCRRFSGSGQVRADGGRSPKDGIYFEGGGGAGGRIAIYRTRHLYTGAVSATGGVGFVNGQPGTIVWGDYPAGGLQFTLW